MLGEYFQKKKIFMEDKLFAKTYGEVILNERTNDKDMTRWKGGGGGGGGDS